MDANLYALIEAHFPPGAGQPFLLIPDAPVVHYDVLAQASARLAHALVRAGCRAGDRGAVPCD